MDCFFFFSLCVHNLRLINAGKKPGFVRMRNEDWNSPRDPRRMTKVSELCAVCCQVLFASESSGKRRKTRFFASMLRPPPSVELGRGWQKLRKKAFFREEGKLLCPIVTNNLGHRWPCLLGLIITRWRVFQPKFLNKAKTIFFWLIKLKNKIMAAEKKVAKANACGQRVIVAYWLVGHIFENSRGFYLTAMHIFEHAVSGSKKLWIFSREGGGEC